MFLRQIFGLLTAILLAEAPVFSQNGSPYSRHECVYVLPDTTWFTVSNKLPFSEITIIDARPDTMKLGYLYTSAIHEKQVICTEKNISQMIRSFLSDKFIAPGVSRGDKILGCIRKFWISDFGVDTSRYNLSLTIEYYLHRDGCFYPFYRFDSSVVLNGTAETWGNSINKAISASARKLFHVDRVNIQQLQCYSLRQIDSFNYAARNFPILRDKRIQRGVYFSFNQFKRNKPWYPIFGINVEQESDVIYVKGRNLKDSAIADAWGFSDGNRLFIRYGGNFYRLFRTGDNFEFFAEDKTQQTPPDPYIPGPFISNPIEAGIDVAVQKLLSKTKKPELLSLYLLDMESGRIIRP
jgi:hypothetical protein